MILCLDKVACHSVLLVVAAAVSLVVGKFGIVFLWYWRGGKGGNDSESL